MSEFDLERAILEEGLAFKPDSTLDVSLSVKLIKGIFNHARSAERAKAEGLVEAINEHHVWCASTGTTSANHDSHTCWACKALAHYRKEKKG